MTHIEETRVTTRPLSPFARLIGRERFREVREVGDALRQRLARRVVWNVNSTAVGGGVAEMLQPLLGYARSIGIDARWMVIRGNPDFFRVTKRLHHALHGSRGDGSSLGRREHEIYRKTLRDNALEMASLVRPRDIVLLHDPQTAGLAAPLMRRGAIVVWRCHIGHDHPSAEAEKGWEFLFPYLKEIPAFVFSRDAYIPSYCDHGKSSIIRPSIDAFSPKNQRLSPSAVRTILVHVGLVEGPPPTHPDHGFRREDGTPGRVERRAEVIRVGRAPRRQTPLVVQVSRWDPLKDPVGVMRGFAGLVAGGCPANAELVLAGPDVKAVSDDPEGGMVFQQVLEVWREFPQSVRERIHLAMLPIRDVEENAAIVNALQRHATVVVQKSLQEGFGLTVTEAMWKAKPVVASAVGGIQDQIEDGRHGLLLRDPEDLRAFGAAVRRLLEDPALAARLGQAARERVRDEFLGVRHLLEYARLIERLDCP